MSSPPASERIITLTPTAASHMRTLLNKTPSPQAIRLSLKNSGCAGMSYNLSYVSHPQPKDIIQKEQNITLYIDPFASIFLIGTIVDFEQTPISNGFTFKSPKATGQCGCGESVTFK